MPSFKKYGIMIAVMLMALVTMPMSALAADDPFAAFKEAVEKGGSVTLSEDIIVTKAITITNKVILDLNGHQLKTNTTTTNIFIVSSDAADLTVNDTVGGGKVIALTVDGKKSGGGTPIKILAGGTCIVNQGTFTGDDCCFRLYGANNGATFNESPIKSTLTVNNGAVVSSDADYVYGIFIVGNGAKLNFYGGMISVANGAAIGGNGNANNGGTEINIAGGNVNSQNIAIYHPQAGILNISNGSISGTDGVQFKSGTLNMTGGKIVAFGDKPKSYPDNSNGSVDTASAISIISNINYTGAINIDISGNAVLESKNACAVFSKITVGDATHFNGITISGGTFTGGDKSLLLNDIDKVKIAVTGGVYNSDPTAYVASGYVARKATDSKYVVTKEGTLGKVALSPATLTLKVSETGTVSAVAAVTGEEISWTTSDSSVATVDAGKVTAVKAGIAVITAKGDVTKSSASCIVTVTDPANTDTTPTPAPVEPTIVTKENSPITTDTNVPETVKPATPVITEANEANITALAASADIAEEHLVASANGLITISPAFAQDAVKSLMSADTTVQPKAIATLPIVKAEVDKGLVAALAFTVKGSDLYADKDNIVSDINLIKILKDKTAAKFTYVSDPAAYDDKCFTLKDSNGKNLLATDSVAPDKAYTLIVFVKDNGDFDYDKTDGSVIDPMAVATNAATVTPTPTPTPSSGSSSGCNAGVAMLALLALVPLAYRRKK